MTCTDITVETGNQELVRRLGLGVGVGVGVGGGLDITVVAGNRSLRVAATPNP